MLHCVVCYEMISLLWDQLASPCFSFPLNTFADQQKRKMNASISDAEPPPPLHHSHLLPSRFHIKLVIAYDPARHDSHSGRPCYMNEIWWNANIYAHTFAFWASLIIASASVLKEEQLSLDTWNYTEECTNARVRYKSQPRQVLPHRGVQIQVSVK